MAVNRAGIVDKKFLDGVAALSPGPRRDDLDAPVRDGSSCSARLALQIFDSMLASRLLDMEARELKGRKQGFYTIGSAGHEANAAVAAALRPTDPAFLHYRSGAFFLHRASQVPGTTPLFDVLLGMVASRDEPIAGGRHKVFGSAPLWVPPQTSTIASHLPKAVGAAFFIDRLKRLERSSPIPDDSIAVCTFGDASSNHATACTAFNAAALCHHQNLPCPVLFVCEDNGIGISVRTPRDWVARRFQADAGVKYFYGDGLDFPHAFDSARQAVAFVRSTRRPAILHLRVIRMLGHAGSDVEQLYRSEGEINAIEAQDPLLRAARELVEGGWATPGEILEQTHQLRTRIAALGREAEKRPKLTTAEEVIAPLAPHSADAVAVDATTPPPAEIRDRFFGGRLPEDDRPRHMAKQINRALHDLMARCPETVLFGEDVARKGGVYHVTANLEAAAGKARVFNSPLDETTILGLAMGAGHLGLVPIPEIQYLAYLHNAIDQLRGEAASLQFFSMGAFRNPMVVRIASLAYQKGFGGHFHNDNSIAALRDIPGLLIACPSNGEDAVGMLRTAVAAARVDGAVVAFLEPIALYMTKDLHEDRDGLWSFPYPGPEHHVPVGRARTWTEGADLTILSYANGLWMSLRVAKRLEEQHGIGCRVVDLRWLTPLPEDDLVEAAAATGTCLVVDEGRKTGGVAEAVLTVLALRAPEVRVGRVVGHDTFIPLGDAANRVLVQEPDIEAAALQLMEA